MTVRIATLFLLAGMTLHMGCAARQDPLVTEAVEDFVVVAELEELDKIRTRLGYSWDYLSEEFIIVKTRDGEYLVRFRRKCRELNQYPVQPDIRYDDSALRSRTDTIRGCHIGAIYAIEPGQADELRHLGEAPGERLQ